MGRAKATPPNSASSRRHSARRSPPSSSRGGTAAGQCSAGHRPSPLIVEPPAVARRRRASGRRSSRPAVGHSGRPGRMPDRLSAGPGADRRILGGLREHGVRAGSRRPCGAASACRTARTARTGRDTGRSRAVGARTARLGRDRTPPFRGRPGPPPPEVAAGHRPGRRNPGAAAGSGRPQGWKGIYRMLILAAHVGVPEPAKGQIETFQLHEQSTGVTPGSLRSDLGGVLLPGGRRGPPPTGARCQPRSRVPRGRSQGLSPAPGPGPYARHRSFPRVAPAAVLGVQRRVIGQPPGPGHRLDEHHPPRLLVRGQQ